VRQLEADYSIGESEQKVEMAFGDFGAAVSVSAPSASEVYIQRAAGPRRLDPHRSAPSAGEVYVPHPHGGTVGFGLRPALSRGSAG
jgi:hypothetical protein